MKKNKPIHYPTLLLLASLLLCCLPSIVGAQSVLSKPVNFAVKRASLPLALAELSHQSGVEIAFSERFFEGAAPLTLRVEGRPLREVLALVLKESDTDFKEVDGQIVVFLAGKKEQQYTLSGYVEDAETGERLIAATVWCPKAGRGTLSNEYGFFSLSLPGGEAEIWASYIGYTEQRRALTLKDDQKLQLSLQPSVTLAEVVVTPKQFAAGSLLPSEGGGHQLATPHLQAAPALGGMSDLMRMSYLLPGVQTGADGSGGMHVRGGDTDQNLVMLDGAPIYNHEHLMGLFSVYNTSAIRSAKLLKGYFPARYGGRVSSVLDVRTREGNQKQWSAEAGIDLLSARATLEGPLVKEKGALLVSFRRTHSDFYLQPHINRSFIPEEEDIKFDSRYFFHDLNAKLNYQVTPKDRLFLSFYRGQDLLSAKLNIAEVPTDSASETGEFTFRWGNTLTAMRWNHIFGKKLFANATLTYSQYRHLFGLFSNFAYDDGTGNVVSDYFFFEFSSNIRDQAARVDFEYALSPRHYLRFGGGYTLHKIQPGFLSSFEESSQDSFDIEDFIGQFEGVDSIGHEWEVYAEDEFNPSEHWHLNLGLRWSGFRSKTGASYNYPEPRLLLRRDLGPRLSAHASLCRMTQYLHRTTSNTDLFGFQVWTPSSVLKQPLTSWQATLGVEASLPQGLQLSVEAYWKRNSNLSSFDFSDSTIFELPEVTLEDFIRSSSLTSQGIEFLLERTQGRTGGWLAYTFSDSQQDEVPAGFVSAFNRRHEVKLLLHRRLGEHWQVSLSGVYGSPSSPVIESEAGTFLFGGASTLLPDGVKIDPKPNHRVDLGVAYSRQTGPWHHRLQASIYNAYNRKNVAYYRPINDEDGVVLTYQPMYLLPLMPGVSYEVRF